MMMNAWKPRLKNKQPRQQNIEHQLKLQLLNKRHQSLYYWNLAVVQVLKPIKQTMVHVAMLPNLKFTTWRLPTAETLYSGALYAPIPKATALYTLLLMAMRVNLNY